MMSERSDEREVAIDELPSVLEHRDLHFDCGDAVTDIEQIEISLIRHNETILTDNIVSPTRLGLLINSKVKNIFDSLGVNNVQFFKVNLMNINGNEIFTDYFIANIIGKRSCLNKSMSEIEYYDNGDVQFIDKLSLNLHEGDNYGNIFRLAEFLPILIVSDKLKNSLEENSVSGFSFYKPEGFSL